MSDPKDIIIASLAAVLLVELALTAVLVMTLFK